jgi:hypothetical protein
LPSKTSYMGALSNTANDEPIDGMLF